MQRGLRCSLAVLLLVAAQSARALDARYSLAQYQHTRWTEREGAPTNIVGIAVGDDGYLWVASPRGVSRFDGFEFKPVSRIGSESLAQDTITALFGGPHKEVFMDFGAGKGSGMVSGGRLIRFPGCNLAASAIDVAGATWLICNGRPGRLVGEQVEPLGKGWNLPEDGVTSLAYDSHGTIWASSGAQLSSLPKGASAFRSFAGGDFGAAVPGPDDTLWSAGPAGLTAGPASGGLRSATATVLPGSFSRFLFDRDGGLWAVDSGGLMHVGDARRLLRPASARASTPDVMPRPSGVASDDVTSIFEDDRGSIWVGTSAGLERFKDNYFFPIRIPGHALAPSIAAGDNGTIWAANYTGKLMQISDASIRTFDVIDGGATCLARDRDGIVWVAAEQGRLFQIRGAEISRAIGIPAEIHGSAITDISKDIHGALWVGATINGVVGTYAQGRWTMPHGYGGLPDRWASRTILADSQGRLWASRHYDVMRLENGFATRLSVAQGLEVGDIYALSERGPRVWVGGSRGVAYFDGARFQTLKPASDGAFSEISEVLETESGDLWLHEFDAAVRVPAAELEKQRRNPAYRVMTERFDSLDGLYGNSPQLAARSSMVEATDGRLWFSTSEGVAVVDPKRARPRPYVPQVHVQGVYVDGAERDPAAPFDLPRRTKSVRFLYTAVSPAGAEHVRYRYRLEGLDSDWTDAGSRRAITYNSLAPGHYRFRVESSDDRGTWAANDSTFAFSVQPLWFETLSFRMAYALCAALGIWVVYNWQVTRTTRRVRLQMRVQQMERERIARDLHDTLLQGVQALIWRVHGIAEGIPPGDAVRASLDGAMEVTEGLLAESRRRVMVLREERSVPLPLSEALRNVIDNAASLHAYSYSTVVTGDEVPITETVQVDICDIVREALANAATHGRATSVDLKIGFSRRALVVQIVDNGSGFEPEVALRGRRGHWGIAGMRERARELGGSLQIRTVPGQGTEVTLRMQARKAFETAPGGRWVGRATGWLRATRPGRERIARPRI